MEFRILGRFEVIERGQQVALGGARPRALLAVLVLHRRHVVSIDRLVEELWGERPPATAAKTVQVYVSRLRKAVGDGLLQTRGRGYVLALDPGQVDADRFETLIDDGRLALESGDAARAVEFLGAALELWRGPALEEFMYEPFAQQGVARLEEARLAAIEDRVDAQLQLGAGAELVGELEQLVAERPPRERLVAALMLALYRGGRQSEALAVCRAARERLVQELGLEPGPEIADLERRILLHDPALAARRPEALAARRPEALAAGRPETLAFRARFWTRTRRRRFVAATTIAAMLTVGLGLGLGAGARPPGLSPAALAGTNGVVAVSLRTGRVVSATPLAGSVGAVSAGEGSVWAADPGDGTIAQIDVRSSAAVDRIPLGGRPGSVVSGAGAIWVASTVGGRVVRLDPVTGSIVQTISIPGSNPDAMAIGRGELWITDSVARRLFEIDARSGALRRSVPLSLQPSGVALADNAIWISGYDTGTVEKLDPATGRTIGRVGVGGGPVALVSQGGALWVANQLDGTVSRIDPEALVVRATIPVGSGPSALAAAGGSVWVANQYSDNVVRIGAHSNRIAESVEIGGAPTSLTINAGRLWVGVGASAGSHRGGTLVMVTTQRFASADPAFYGVATSPQFIGLAYDTLVTFAHSGGSDGLRLVPDLALAIPAPQDGGRTYTFRLRPGIRYSDGRRPRASDFRRAIERLFRAGSPGASFFQGLVGAAACARSPATCELAHGVLTDDARGVVTFRLRAPDSEFPFKLSEQGYSAPIPAGTPDHDGGSDVPPGTGPYRIAAVTDSGVRFTRNPYFREWSHAAQPAGNPDAIVWRYARSARAAVAAVEAGRADWLFGLIPPAEYRALQLRDASRLHSTPQFAVDFLPLNTHRPPFDDVRVRRALNFAIDRGRLAQIYGGPAFADPTCQPLSPGLPGYRRYCPYTLRPSRDGAWRAPDLATARRLVAASGTRGQRVDLWGMSDESYVPPEVSTYTAGVLRSLGYQVHLHVVSYASISEAHRRRFQLSTDGDWQADYPDPSSYLPQFFACGGGDSNGYYCNPALDREMSVASRLRLAGAAKADALWQSIDHQLTDRAAWVPTVNLHEVDVVSSRLHDYDYNPVWGFLPDQSWLGRH